MRILLSVCRTQSFWPILILAISMLQVSCQSVKVDSRVDSVDQSLLERIQQDEALSVVDDEVKVPFATGTLELVEPGWTSGYGAATRAGLTHDELKSLYAKRLWPLIVNLVVKQNFGDDLHYYLLGQSAEKLGYPEAAVIYYEKSIVQSGRPLRGKCINCMSIKFPERSIVSLERVRSRVENK